MILQVIFEFSPLWNTCREQVLDSAETRLRLRGLVLEKWFDMIPVKSVPIKPSNRAALREGLLLTPQYQIWKVSENGMLSWYKSTAQLKELQERRRPSKQGILIKSLLGSLLDHLIKLWDKSALQRPDCQQGGHEPGRKCDTRVGCWFLILPTQQDKHSLWNKG